MSSVSRLGARVLVCLAAACVVAAMLAAGVESAEARSKKRFHRAPRPAPVSSFTGASNYAALVVDAKTGRTLYERNPDNLRYPASVTKVMALYLVFEDLERGRIRLDTRMTMSADCASRAPSKLGLRPGQTIDVEDGIKALVTKSANDVACAFGDNLEGSESAFADRMTRKARAIGMSQSTFRNASGLPNASHLTTARDLVTLGRAIQDRFPRYYGYFGTRVFAYGSRKIANHNRLLGRVEGVDGIKTGYTNASGFNLLSSVKHNGRSIVAVVMGGRTGASRDAHMRELIALNLPKAQPGSRTAPLVADASEREAPVRARPAVMASVPTPIAAPLVPTSERMASLEQEIIEQPAPSRPVAQLSSGATPKTRRMVAPEVASVAAASVPIVPAADPAPVLSASPKPMRWVVGAAPTTTGSVDAEPAPTEILEAASEPALVQPVSQQRARIAAAQPVELAKPETDIVRKGWLIQIGATTQASQAEAMLSEAKSKSGLLRGAEPFTETFVRGSTTYYRARFAGLTERTADAACKALKRSAVSCFAIKN